MWLWIAVVVIIYAGGLAFMYAVGLFEFNRVDAEGNPFEEHSAKVIVAAIALVGSLTATVVMLITAILKQSLTQRTERRLFAEHQQNLKLNEQAEERLRNEAAIKGVNLLGTESGQAVSDAQLNGTIMMLSRLGMHSVCVSLTEDERVRSRLLENSLIRIYDSAVESSLDSDREVATKTYASVSQEIAWRKGHMFVPFDSIADKGLLDDHLLWAATVGAGWQLVAAFEKGGNDYHHTELFSRLYSSWKVRPDSKWRRDISAILNYGLQKYPEITVIGFESAGVDFANVRTQVKGCEAVSQQVAELCDALKRAVKGSPKTSK